MSEDDQAEKWLDVLGNDQEPAEAIREFGQLCMKINTLGLTPDWAQLVYDMSAERTRWQDECYAEHILQDHLNWIRNVVLSWLSYVLPSEGTTWYDFLRAKLRAEHMCYKAFSDSR